MGFEKLKEKRRGKYKGRKTVEKVVELEEGK